MHPMKANSSMAYAMDGGKSRLRTVQPTKENGNLGMLREMALSNTWQVRFTKEVCFII